MVLTIVIAVVTSAAIIAGVFFFPQFKLGKIKSDSYWIIALIGALVTIVFGGVKVDYLWAELTAETSINPLKILVLFISMTLISVFLDEAGFFKYLAAKTLRLAKHSQRKLFSALYLVVSALTVFTSNDVIVLTFTPFICYFAKHAKINPLPFLVCEFVAANTASMVFIIGNPTNVFVATSYGVDFITYFQVMLAPSLVASAVAFLMLYAVFGKKLKKPMEADIEEVTMENKAFCIIGVVFLACCTVVLAVGSYIGVEMWAAALVFATVLLGVVLCICFAKKRKPEEIKKTLKRAPWQLVPFVLSMFTVILSLKANGVTEELGKLLGNRGVISKYGAFSYLSANLINNIPMTVLFCPVMNSLSGIELSRAVYATIIGSNIGAYLTPVGALAGIMWTETLKKHEVKLRYRDFVKYGTVIGVPTLFGALITLAFVL